MLKRSFKIYSNLEHLGKELLKLALGDVVAARVDHVDDLYEG